MSQNQQTRLSKCVSYLQQCQLYECANAVSKAAGQVNCFQHGVPVREMFSQRVNSCLCKALFAMNSDPNCDTRNIKHVRTLIEAYRDMNGMPTNNYDLPEAPVDDEYDEVEDAGLDFTDDGEADFEVEIETGDEMIGGAEDVTYDASDEYDIEEVDDVDVEECILGMVQRGGYLTYDDICSQMAECREDEVQIMDALKELVRQGYFEVSARNPYTGEIDMVQAIR